MTDTAVSAIRPEMVFSAAVAMNPELFSTIPDEAHRAASPRRVEIVREEVLSLARKALEAALDPTFIARIEALEAENARLIRERNGLSRIIANLDASETFDDSLLRDIHLRLQIHGEKYPDRMVSVLHRNVVFYKTVEAIKAARTTQEATNAE